MSRNEWRENKVEYAVCEVSWLRDSDLWARFIPSLSAEGGLQSIEILAPFSGESKQVYKFVLPIKAGRILGFLRDGAALITHNLSRDVAQFEVIEVGPNPKLRRRFTTTAPRNATILHLALNPNGDRLAWLVMPKSNRSNSLRWYQVNQLFTRNSARQPVVEIWVSGLEGQGYQLLGTIAKKTGPSGADERLAWSPDGRHLAFGYNGSLYVTDVK